METHVYNGVTYEKQGDQWIPKQSASSPETHVHEGVTYAKQGDQWVPQGGPSESEVIDEAHPDISFTSRLVYKNLGTDQQSGLEYLKKQNPTLQFDIKNNEIVAKKPQESQWRKLDPSGFDVEDITDIGYDIPAAVLETGATALGGVGGGIAGTAVAPGVGTGVGALGGASLAGAGAASGLEAIRQGLGRAFGIEGSQDPSAIKTAAMFGAASPLLFGTGAAAKQVGKVAAKTGMGKEAAEALLRAQSGIPVQTKRALAPAIGERMSGISRDTLRYASKNIDKIGKADDVIERAAVFDEVTDELQQAAVGQRQKIGQELGAAIDDIATEGVDIVNIKSPFTELIQEYEKKAAKKGTKKALEDVEFLKEAYEHYLPKDMDKVSGESAASLLHDLNELTKIAKTPDVGKVKFMSRHTEAEKALQRAATKAATNLDQQIDNISGGRIKEIKRRYKKAVEVDATLAQYFKDPKKTEATLKQLAGSRTGQSTKKLIKQLEKQLGVPIDERATRVVAENLFTNPVKEPLSRDAVTATARAIGGLTAGGAAGYIGAQALGFDPTAGALVGAGLGRRMGSPAAMKRWMQLNQAAGKASRAAHSLGPAYGPAVPQTFINTWQQLGANER